MKNTYMIQDWAGNILDFRGSFKLPQLAVALEFESEDHAYEYMTENNLDDDDLFVVKLERKLK